MSELDNLLDEANEFLGGSPDVSVGNPLEDAEKFLSGEVEDAQEEETKPEPIKIDPALEDAPALKGYEMSYGRARSGVDVPKAPERINGTKFMELVDENKQGKGHDLTKFRLAGMPTGMSEQDMTAAATEMKKAEELNRVRGRKYYLNRSETEVVPGSDINLNSGISGEPMYQAPRRRSSGELTPEAMARRDDGIPGNEIGPFGKVGGVARNIMAPLAARLDGVSTQEFLGKRYTVALESGIQQYNLEKSEEKLGEIYDRMYAEGKVGQPGGPTGTVVTGSMMPAYIPSTEPTPRKNMSKAEFIEDVKKNAKAQRRFNADYEAGLVNHLNQPIIQEDQYKGEIPYQQYLKDMYTNPEKLEPEGVDNINIQGEKFFEHSANLEEEGEAEDSALKKVWSAFDGEVTDALNDVEYKALMNNLGFQEEMTMLGQMLVNQPTETARQMGIAIVEQLPTMLASGKGLGLLGRAGAMAREMNTAKKLKYVTRFSSPRAAEKMRGIKSIQATKAAIARPTLQKLYGLETLEDVGMTYSSGILYEASSGSKYGMKEGLRDMTLGLGASAFIAPIRLVANLKKPTISTVNRAGQYLHFTKGMEKHPDVNNMVKMFASLTDNIAFDKMRAQLDMTHPGKGFLTKADLAARRYAGQEAGMYEVPGWHDKGTGKITLTQGFGPETVVEESSHYLYNHIKQMAKKERAASTEMAGDIPVEGDGPYSQLLSMIGIWEQQTWSQARKLGLDVPQGSELFAQVLTSHMGHSDKLLMGPVVSRIDLPDPLLKGLRRIWADDEVMQGTSKLHPRSEEGGIRPGPEQKPDGPETAPPRDVEHVTKDMDETIKKMGEMEDGPEKTKLKNQYDQLLQERRTIDTSKKLSIIPTGAAMLDNLEANPSATGYAALIDEVSAEMAKPENADIMGALKGIRDRAVSGKRKAPKDKEFALRKEKLVDKEDAPMFYSKLGKLIGTVIKQKMDPGNLNQTLKNKGITKEQIEWIGLDELIKERGKDPKGRINPEEIENLLEQHGVNLMLTSRGRKQPYSVNKIDDGNYELVTQGQEQMPYSLTYYSEQKAWLMEDHEGSPIDSWNTFDEAITDYQKIFSQRDVMEPRFEDQYRLKGGENYEEHVMTMPGQIDKYRPDNMHFTSEGGGTAIGWTRADDRRLVVEGIEGDMARYIDEAQSKRHQDATDKGYSKRIDSKSRDFLASFESKMDNLNMEWKLAVKNDDPEAAFKTDALRDLFTFQKDFINRGGRLQDFPEVKWKQEGDVWVNEEYGFRIENVIAEDRAARMSTWNDDFKTTRDGKLHTHNPTIRMAKADAQMDVYKNVDRNSALETMVEEFDPPGRNKNGVPDAPFKKQWSDMLMKQELRLAIDDGMDYLTWSTGKIQADRWAMEEHVDEIEFVKRDNGRYDFKSMLRGSSRYGETDVTAARLNEVLGPEIANDIVSNSNNMGSLTGEHLNKYDKKRKKGLEGFYDRGGESSHNITNSMDKFAKKYGGKVEEMEIATEVGRTKWEGPNVSHQDYKDVMEKYSKYRHRKYIGSEGGESAKKNFYYWLEDTVFHMENTTNTFKQQLEERLEDIRPDLRDEYVKLLQENFGGNITVEKPKTAKVWGMRINKKMKRVAEKGFEFQFRKADDGSILTGKKKGKGKRLSLAALKIKGKGEKEHYVGSPENITGTIAQQKKKIVKLANQLEQYAREGIKAKEWYEVSSQMILDITHGDKHEADLLARLIAMTSQQDDVNHNFGESVRMWYQYKDQLNKGVNPKDMKFTGGMIRGEMSKKAKMILTEDYKPAGPKINNFYKNLMVKIDKTMEQSTTNDTWMLRAFGYEGGTTSARHAFMTNTMTAIANKINAKPHQVQAMIWTAVSDRWKKAMPAVLERGVKDGWAVKTGKKISVLEDKVSQKKYYKAMLEATPKLKEEINPETYSYVDALGGMKGQLAWEAVPGKSTGMLPGIHEAPYETRMLLHRKVMDAMTTTDGKNMILKEVGLLEKLGSLVPGIWAGETNPSTVWEIPLPKRLGEIDPLTGKTKVVPESALDDEAEKMMDMASAIFGYYTKQEGVGWAYMQPTKKKADGNALMRPMDRHLTREELVKLEKAINEKFGAGGVAILPNHDGPKFKNLTLEGWWDGERVSNPVWQNQMHDILNDVLQDKDGDTIIMNASGELLRNDWEKNINGEGYYAEISDRGGSELFKKIDGVLAPRIAKAYRDFGDEFGFPFQDPNIPRGSQPGPGLGKSGTDGAVPGTEYQLRRHTEPPPDHHSGPGGQSFDLSSETTWDAFRRTFQDRFYPVKRFQKTAAAAGQPVVEDADTYLHEIVYYGRAQAVVENADETLVTPMVKYMKENKLTMNEVDDFLYARHAPERNKTIAEKHQELGDMQDGGSGMTNEEAGIIMTNFQRDGKLEQLKAMGRMVDRIHAKRLEVMEDAGLIGEDYKGNLPDWKAYVPLRGFEDPHHPLADQGIRPGASGKGFSMNTRERKALGRSSKASSPLANSVSMMNTALVDAEKNRVGGAFLKMVLDNSDVTYTNPAGTQQKLFEVDPVQMMAYLDQNGQVAYRKKTHTTLAPNEFSVMQDGQQHIISVADPSMANAMKQMGSNNAGSWIRPFQFYNRFLASMSTTMNPEFLLSNFTRDFQTAGFHLTAEQSAKTTGQVMKDTFPAMAGMIAMSNGKNSTDPESWTNWARRYKNAGGKVGWFGLNTIEQMTDEIQAKLGRTGKWGKTRDGFSGVAKFLGSMNEGVENSFRLASFKAMIDQGASEMQAAKVAKELTVNFNRRGQAGQVINGLYLFFNASLQGISRMTQAMATNRKLQGIAGGVVAAGYANGVYNYSIGGQNESGYPEFDRVPNYVTERNMVFMDPSQDGEYTKIPMPYGYNIFWNMGHAMAQLQYGTKSKGDISKDMMMATISAFNPLGTMNSKTAMGTVMKSFMPTVGQAGLQHVMNENFAGNPLKPEQTNWGPQKPEHMLYYKSVRGSSKKFAKGLSDATGNSIHLPGDLDVSPELIDHYIDGIVGGVGNFTGNLLNTGYSLFNGEKPDVSKTPFLRRFRAETSDYWNTDRFRTILDELGLMKGHEKLIRKNGSDLDRAKLKFMDRSGQLQTQLSQMGKLIRGMEDRGADPVKVNRIKNQRKKVRDKFLRDWRTKIEGAKLDPEPSNKKTGTDG